MNNKERIVKYLQFTVICLNGLYLLWILYNAVAEGFKGINSVQGVAMLGLMVLLVLNIFLLASGKK